MKENMRERGGARSGSINEREHEGEGRGLGVVVKMGVGREKRTLYIAGERDHL